MLPNQRHLRNGTRHVSGGWKARDLGRASSNREGWLDAPSTGLPLTNDCWVLWTKFGAVALIAFNP
ncbi:MAG: hypothetical protein SGPRY_010701, partial [Prymnesium sp.]